MKELARLALKASGIGASDDFAFAGGPWGNHKVPFVFAANGRSYLKQIETESGIGRDDGWLIGGCRGTSRLNLRTS
jgi:hypothetical protein